MLLLEIICICSHWKIWRFDRSKPISISKSHKSPTEKPPHTFEPSADVVVVFSLEYLTFNFITTGRLDCRWWWCRVPLLSPLAMCFFYCCCWWWYVIQIITKFIEMLMGGHTAHHRSSESGPRTKIKRSWEKEKYECFQKTHSRASQRDRLSFFSSFLTRGNNEKLC